MAATTVKPYPHVQINVKDNSIADVQIVETLPVHRPLYVMRTQEGPKGVPTWCNTYSEAVALFGEETFNPANKTYYSRASQFLLNTMTYNGAFIVRYLPENHATAKYVLYARVSKKTGIPQYEYQNGQRKLEFDPYGNEWVEVQKKDAYDNPVYEDGVQVCYGTRQLAAGEELDQLVARRVGDAYEFPIFVFTAKYDGAYGNDLAVRLFYSSTSNDSADVSVYKTLFYNIGFMRREFDSTTVNAITDVYNRENAAFAANAETVNLDSGAYMGIDAVLDKGFSDTTHQLPVDFYPYTSSFSCIGNIIAAYESAESLNGYDSSLPLKDDDHVDGCLTDEEKELIKTVYFGTPTAEQTELAKAITFGYRVNGVSCVGITGIAYDHAVMGESTDSAFVKAELTSSAQFFLGTLESDRGSDGKFIADTDNTSADADGNLGWASDDKAMYQFCKLQLPVVKDTIVESLHYPFTHIFDIGYSIKTKKAILSFLDTRDDFMAIMSSQVLMTDGSGRPIRINDQATDETNVETLRAYALLRRESVLYGTDCMRAAIYCHTGKLADSTSTAYYDKTNVSAESLFTEYVPFTYWDALQYAKYGNLTYMSADEPRGLPNAYNLLFKEWNWNNYRADVQSRVWDAGANYVQYADMTRLFYPSLRTVYRASTSVLIDEWFVAAVVYAKYVCKHAWAQFSGRNDAAATLQGAIKQYLDKELTSLFNNKYTFETSVYQTAEEEVLGYVQHVKLSITSPATMRVLDVDIEVNRENFSSEE